MKKFSRKISKLRISKSESKFWTVNASGEETTKTFRIVHKLANAEGFTFRKFDNHIS